MYPFPTLRSSLALSAFTALSALTAFADTSDSDHYLEALAATQNFSLGRPIQAMPTADGKSVIFLRTASSRDRTTGLYRFDVASGQTEELATPEKLQGEQTENLSPEDKMRRQRNGTKVTCRTSFELSEDGTQIAFTLPNGLFLYRLSTESLVRPKTGGSDVLDPTFSPDGRKVAYVRDSNLFVYDLETNQEHPITTGGTESKTYGTAELVAQEEMARTKGFWWLPDNKTVVYQVNDNSKVEVWYVGDPSTPQNRPYPSRYPRPRKDNVAARLAMSATDGNAGINTNDAGKDGKPEPARWIEWDREKYPYLARVSPSKFGPLTITVETRDQHELALLEVDLKTGATHPLLKEADSNWVIFDQSFPVWLPSLHLFCTTQIIL